jgi:hypothetical protein
MKHKFCIVARKGWRVRSTHRTFKLAKEQLLKMGTRQRRTYRLTRCARSQRPGAFTEASKVIRDAREPLDVPLPPVPRVYDYPG